MPAKFVYWLLLGALAVTSGCQSTGPFVWVRDFPFQEQVRRIQPGDTLSIAVRGQADLSGTYVVRENGTVLQPIIGEVPITGLSEAEASKRFAGLLKGVVVKPRVVVSITKPRPVRIAALGEVTTPGQFEVEYDETVLSVIARAGGLTPYADRNSIYVVRKRPQVIRVRFRYDELKSGEPASSAFELHDGDVIVVE